MERSPSLRRAKIQQNKARNQALIASVVGIVLFIFFLFVIVPFIFDLAIRSARSGSTGILGQEDTLPPQRPMVQSLPDALNTTEIEVKGYTETGAQVMLIVDGNELGGAKADSEGAFSFKQTLTEGDHEIWVVAQDEAENMSPLSDTFKVKIDTTQPTFSINEPQEGAVFTLPRERVITIKGKASEKVSVSMNSSIFSSNDDGEFQATLQLGEGKNEITFKAVDLAGNESEEKKLSVEYRP